MPLERTSCTFGDFHTICPECSDSNVTPRDNPSLSSPNDLVDYGGESEVTYKHICWSCGWTEHVTVTIERHNERN